MKDLIKRAEVQTEGIDWEFFRDNFLRSQKGLSYLTVTAYKTAINCFTRYMASKDITHPVQDDIYDYQDYLQKENKSIFTQNLYMVSLKKFFEYLGKPYEGQDFKAYADIYSMAAPRIRRPERRKHHREMPTETEVQKLRDLLKDKDRKSSRDLLMVDLALYCGLRVNEIVNVRVEDIRQDGDKYRLYVLRKGHTSRNYYVYLDAGIAKRLQAYNKKYKLKRYVFTDIAHNKTKERLSSTTISVTISENMKKAGIKRKTLTAHSLRHYAGTKYYQETKDLYATQQFMGHKDSATTEVYMHVENNYSRVGVTLSPA